MTPVGVFFTAFLPLGVNEQALCQQPHFVPKCRVWGGSPTSVFAARRDAKIASVATLALLAVSALPPTVVFWELVAYNVKIVFDIFRKENQKKL